MIIGTAEPIKIGEQLTLNIYNHPDKTWYITPVLVIREATCEDWEQYVIEGGWDSEERVKKLSHTNNYFYEVSTD